MRHAAPVALLAWTAVAPGGVRSAAAQGYAVYEHGTCAMGRAGTGVAAPCRDGSAVFYNPAGLVGRRGIDLTAGVTLIDAFGGFINDTTGRRTDLANDPIPVPHFFARYAPNERMAAAVGVFVPYGLGTEWPTTFEGRFAGYDNDLRSIYVQPTLAYEIVPGLKLGAGFDVILSKIQLNQRIDLFEQETSVPGLGTILIGQLGIPQNTEIAEGFVESGYDRAFAGHFGVQIELSPRISFGARFLTQATVDYEATVDFTQLPTGIILPDGTIFGVPGLLPLDTVVAGLMAAGESLSDQTATTSLPMPAQLVAGFAVELYHDLTAMADYQFTRWSAFDTLRLEFETGGEIVLPENYEDTHAVRGGLEWNAAPQHTLRLGYLWHTAAAPDLTVTPLLPEGRRNEVTLGYGFQATPGFRVDAAYQYIRQDDRRGRMRNPLPGDPPSPDLNVGVYQFRAHLFGLTLHYAF